MGCFHLFYFFSGGKSIPGSKKSTATQAVTEHQLNVNRYGKVSKGSSYRQKTPRLA
jgi:hypothetical protein